MVLAAGRAAALGPVTADMPLCMVDIRGQPLLKRLVDTLAGCGVAETTVVRGYRKDAIALPGVCTVDNDSWETTGEAASLARAAERMQAESVVVYGDMLFRRHILDGMRAADGDVVVAVDVLGGKPGGRTPHPRDLVGASRPYAPDDLDETAATVAAVGEGGTDGEWIGLMRTTARGSTLVREELAAMAADGTLDHADLPALLTRLAKRTPVAIHWVTGHWLDVDTMLDLADARNFP